MASILNNFGSLSSSRRLGQTERSLGNVINRLSTGSRINRASDDAAGLQISNNLRADLKIFGQARRNANVGLGITNIANGSLKQASGLLQRASEIATQAASGTTSTEGRDALNSEFQEILGQLDTLGGVKFDGQDIFGTTTSVKVGEDAGQEIDIQVDALSAASTGLAGDDLLSEGNADTALSNIQNALDSVSSSQGRLGAIQQRLDTTINSLSITSENIQAAESQIRDADVAEEVVNLTKLQILSKTGNNAIVQSNIQAKNVLSLLG